MTVELTRDGALAIVKLNRPDKLNALTEEMKAELTEIFTKLATEADVGAILLTAAGRGFCAGGDVSSMGQFTVTLAQARLKRAQKVVLTLANIEKPVIAAVRGPVAGIGWSMALACDMILASETAKFHQSFKNIGLVPDGGAVYFLTQVLGVFKAKELVYTAQPTTAAEALDLGLVNRVVRDEDLEQEGLKLAQELAAGPGYALGAAKKLFKSMYVPSLDVFLESEAWAQGLAMMSEDHQEGARAFQEKRRPAFKRS